MSRCPNCGKELNSNELYCPRCGGRINIHYGDNTLIVNTLNKSDIKVTPFYVDKIITTIVCTMILWMTLVVIDMYMIYSSDYVLYGIVSFLISLILVMLVSRSNKQSASSVPDYTYYFYNNRMEAVQKKNDMPIVIDYDSIRNIKFIKGSIINAGNIILETNKGSVSLKNIENVERVYNEIKKKVGVGNE